MTLKLRDEKLYSNIRLIYITAVLIYSLLRQFVVAVQPILMSNVFNTVIILAAGILFLWDIAVFRNVLKTKYIWLLVAVFAATLLTTVVNFKYAFVDNIKAAANMFIQFFILYAAGNKLTRERIDKEIRVIATAVSGLWFVTGIISVVMYFLDICYTQTNYIWGEPTEIWQGFVRADDGMVVMRLWGVYVDPNFASAVSIIVICLCAYLLYLRPKKTEKIIHIVNIVVQSLYIVLSGSRMAMLILLLLAAVGAWYFSRKYLNAKNIKKLKNSILKEAVSIVLAASCVVCCYGVYTVTKKTLPFVRYGVSTVQSLFKPDSELPSEDEETTDDLEELDREDVSTKTDISNGRLNMWLEGFEVFKKNPVIGVGPRSYSIIANEIDPEMRIAEKSIHNSYMELLMGNGVVGFVLMLIFFALCAKDGIILRSRSDAESIRVGILLLIALSALAGGMFISSMFYYMSGISIIAFTMLGYSGAIIADIDREKKNGK